MEFPGRSSQLRILSWSTEMLPGKKLKGKPYRRTAMRTSPRPAASLRSPLVLAPRWWGSRWRRTTAAELDSCLLKEATAGWWCSQPPGAMARSSGSRTLLASCTRCWWRSMPARTRRRLSSKWVSTAREADTHWLSHLATPVLDVCLASATGGKNKVRCGFPVDYKFLHVANNLHLHEIPSGREELKGTSLFMGYTYVSHMHRSKCGSAQSSDGFAMAQ